MVPFPYRRGPRPPARRLIVQEQVSEYARRPTTTAYVDLGLPIPLSYDIDLLSVLVQDPFRVHVLWEISGKTWDALRSAFSEEGEGKFHTALRVRDPEAHWQGIHEVGLASSWWLEVYPDRGYEIEVGVISADLGFIKLLGPRRLTTPAASAPVNASESLPDAFVPPRFEDRSELARRLEELVLASSIGSIAPEFLRVLLKLLRQERLAESDWASLPPWLRDRLRSVAAGGGDAVLGRALEEYLPDLGIELGWPGRFPPEIADSETVSVPGSSEILAGPAARAQWPPSSSRLSRSK